MEQPATKLLFIINPGSGNKKTDWTALIQKYFADRPFQIQLFNIPQPCQSGILKKTIDAAAASTVVAVGGDGTIKLVAECLCNTEMALGILPGGSANGMAKELRIPDDPEAAMNIIAGGRKRSIHLVNINKELCIHLSDIGFNAFVIKKFEEENTRGMWGYVKAAWKVLWRNRRMHVHIDVDNQRIDIDAAMVVIANATMYGNGVVINPNGSLYDELFEVVIIKKVSFSEIFKMRFTQRRFDPAKTEYYQTKSLHIKSKHFVHFQVDGEGKGKVKEIKAFILPKSINVIVPEETPQS